MAHRQRIAIVSDVHYASDAEKARGDDYELRTLGLFQRLFLRTFRRFVWLRQPLRHNHLLADFITQAGTPDLVIANGDYSCDSAFVGVSDPAAFQSASECLGKLRQAFAPSFQAIMGDHELGKLSFFGRRGGLRLASWGRAVDGLGLKPIWQLELGGYVLLGVTSTLIALPMYRPDTPAEELEGWEELRARHLEAVRAAFRALRPAQRVILFCHDPSALPFLWREDAVRERTGQIERTVIGHLHSPLIYGKSRLLAGMPRISFLGHTAKRMTTALSEARHWRPFRPLLCPSLAGIELLKDGGFCTVELDPEMREPAVFQRHRLPRGRPG